MGLLDVLNGMQNGPRGPSTPSAGSRGGMSPMTMAILALLGYKAFKSFTGGQAGANPVSPGALPGGSPVNPGVPGAAGGLGDLLQGGLGSLFGGREGGNVLSGGLNDLLKQFQQNGHGDAANSWIGSGPNKAISPKDLASALGADQINSLMAQSGMSRDELLSGLSQQLPDVIDQLTPDGRLPTGHEAARLI
jgi:uncharacterized protein YidB (DUF937 family)